MAEHKHAAVLRAIADGKAVQLRTALQGVWIDFDVDSHINPITSGINAEWRIKPEPKPDVVEYLVREGVAEWFTYDEFKNIDIDQIKIVRDGETGKLKSAEVLP